jgi:hypothetical protein
MYIYWPDYSTRKQIDAHRSYALHRILLNYNKRCFVWVYCTMSLYVIGISGIWVHVYNTNFDSWCESPENIKGGFPHLMWKPLVGPSLVLDANNRMTWNRHMQKVSHITTNITSKSSSGTMQQDNCRHLVYALVHTVWLGKVVSCLATHISYVRGSFGMFCGGTFRLSFLLSVFLITACPRCSLGSSCTLFVCGLVYWLFCLTWTNQQQCDTRDALSV